MGENKKGKNTLIFTLKNNWRRGRYGKKNKKGRLAEKRLAVIREIERREMMAIICVRCKKVLVDCGEVGESACPECARTMPPWRILIWDDGDDGIVLLEHPCGQKIVLEPGMVVGQPLIQCKHCGEYGFPERERRIS